MSEADKPGKKQRVGYGKPPASSRFKKGQSGNPRGRPKGSRSELPYEAVLGQMVTVRRDGEEQRVTAAEAFLLYLTKKALEGDSAAASQSMSSIENARNVRPQADQLGPSSIVVVFVSPGSVNSALEPLRMGRKLDRFRDTARMMLEPWIVQASLNRLGKRRLTREEQKSVVRATRTPHKVIWPDWWKEK
ncbi:MAG: DUF5681 domain-containing protein [Fimbriimonadaceae bacterium]|nr:DUF5681 domain-containing protein [Alphaproteobacteria bacterium]